MQSNLLPGVQEKQRNGDGAEEVHERSGDHRGTHPAHVFAEQSLRGFAEFANFKVFHAEGFDNAIAADGLLQDLAQVAEAGLAVLRRPANPAAGFVSWPRHPTQPDTAAPPPFSIDASKDPPENH